MDADDPPECRKKKYPGLVLDNIPKEELFNLHDIDDTLSDYLLNMRKGEGKAYIYNNYID